MVPSDSRSGTNGTSNKGGQAGDVGRYSRRGRLRVLEFLLPRPRFAADQEKDYGLVRQQEAMHIYPYLCAFMLMSTILYTFVSGMSSPELVWLRINNYISAFFGCTGVLMLKYRRNWLTVKATDNLAFVWCMHYVAYQSFTFRRIQIVLGKFGSPEKLPEPDECHLILWMLIGILCATNLRIMSTSHALALSVLAPCIWFLGVVGLSSVHSLFAAINIAVIYIILCGLSWLGARQADTQFRQRYQEVNHLKSEQSEVRRIMRHASVPVAIVSRNQNSDASSTMSQGSYLQVDLWNDALKEMTSAEVPEGSPLSGVAALKESHRNRLETAVCRALDGATSRRLLMQLVASRGIVWLQVDVWPLLSDVENVEPQAVIIGSDVTEYVERHYSLLYSENGDEQVADDPEARPDGGVESSTDGSSLALGFELRPQKIPNSETDIVAQIVFPDLTLTRCSPNFNVFFGERMDGKSLLQRICRTDDQKEIKSAVHRTAGGQGPNDVIAPVLLERWSNSRSCRVQRQSKILRLQFHIPEETDIPVQCDEQEEQQAVGLQIQLMEDDGVTFDTPSTSRSLPPGSKSDLGAGISKSNSDIGAGGSALKSGLRGKNSDGGKASLKQSAGSFDSSADESSTKHKHDPIVVFATAMHLTELARHLPPASKHGSLDLIRQALDYAMKASDIPYSRIKAWMCKQCTSFNDFDETFCYVCDAPAEPEFPRSIGHSPVKMSL